MKKPLWAFYKILKNDSSIVVSIDQYLDFCKAFQELSLDHIQKPDDLRDFCKLFFLDYLRNEAEFNRLFDVFVDWKQLLSKDDIPDPVEEKEFWWKKIYLES